LSHDPVQRRRAREIVLHFEKQKADTEFLGFCLQRGQDCPLEEGVWLLAKTEYPDICVEAYRAILDDYAQALRERLVAVAKPRQLLEVISDYLFGQLGFAGNEPDYYDPENSYFNRVLDRRTGNPIGLCLLYLLLAKRLQLPITGIGLPGHFVCRYQSSAAEIYIDAFGRGKLMTKADCVQYLLNGNYSVRDEYLSPVSPRRILLRVCSNLHQIYGQNGRQTDVIRTQRYTIALSK
jgi:regulator of sirC expression with transglutaminase-like and TPR domain